ncbi:hypothetical protein JQ612_27715 [Bradyrhizobium manausense]|uniref:hypothetical protein n=1 Tax=Bradyrhizobium manausense TaxID=989370 RepID=UPI001BA5E852|nr:hypothetical protein [Bradyrhizobium manausense]MBR0837000.1 hypothetical protein [Bradyrhizobium manausense]
MRFGFVVSRGFRAFGNISFMKIPAQKTKQTGSEQIDCPLSLRWSQADAKEFDQGSVTLFVPRAAKRAQASMLMCSQHEHGASAAGSRLPGSSEKVSHKLESGTAADKAQHTLANEYRAHRHGSIRLATAFDNESTSAGTCMSEGRTATPEARASIALNVEPAQAIPDDANAQDSRRGHPIHAKRAVFRQAIQTGSDDLHGQAPEAVSSLRHPEGLSKPGRLPAVCARS